jgi:hypothetical protein
MLHTDLFYEISLYCKPYILSVNKELNLLYSEEWFKTKLQRLFPDKKLFTITNYMDLYKKYLEEGDIHCIGTYRVHILKTRGVRAQYGYPKCVEGIPFHYILTFNGELYLEKQGESKLIDTEVIDVTSMGYIKQHKAYIGDDFKEITFEEELRQIVYFSCNTCILSTKGLHVYNYMDYCFYENNNITNIIKRDKCYFFDTNNTMYEGGNYNFVKSNKNLDINTFHTKRGNIITFKLNILYIDNQCIDTNIKKIISDDNEAGYYGNKILYYIK